MMWSYALLDPVTQRRETSARQRGRTAPAECDTCLDEHLVTVIASDGDWTEIACPCCVPNDALGG